MKHYGAWLIVGLILTLQACYKDVGPVEPELQIPSEVSYSRDVQPIFDAYCVSCHPSSGNLDLRRGYSYNNIVNVPASGYPGILVVPNDPEASVLYKKIDKSGVYGANMPIGRPLSTTDITIIRTWIEQGAPDN